MKKIRKCPKFGNYTLREKCPNCSNDEEVKTNSAHPAKFSPEDPYGKYRRKLKIKELDLGLDPESVD